MEDGEDSESGVLSTLDEVMPVRTMGLGEESALAGWQGRLSQMGQDALKELRERAVGYAKREVRRYWYWGEENEPALPGGYSVEGIAHRAFEKLLEGEAAGVPKVYSGEDIGHELERLIKHQVWRLHAKSENRLVVSEWDVLPPLPDGELVSVFDQMMGEIPSPDRDLMSKEKEELLNEFRKGFEASLGRREDLRLVFNGILDGEKRREGAARLRLQPERVKQLKAQLFRRLLDFSARARGGIAEMLRRMRGGRRAEGKGGEG